VNLRQMLSNVRTRCGDPRAQKPGDRALLLLLSTQIQTFVNETSLTGRPWAVDELSLVVSANTEDYPLPIDSHFGKPIMVRTVYPSNPGLIERDVDFIDLGEFNHDWPFPKDAGVGWSVDGSPNTAGRLAFFRKSGTDQIWVRVLPIPQQSAEYQVLYQVGVYGETVPLDETPLLPEHHGLIEVRAAIAALPHCEWSDDQRANTERRKELAMTLDVDQQRLERIFRRYIATTSASVRPSYRVPPFSID
jgi:hypothetical protein